MESGCCNETHSDLADKTCPQQSHHEKEPVVNDMRPGGHPNVLGQYPWQGQHHVRGADDDDALDQVPVKGRHVD